MKPDTCQDANARFLCGSFSKRWVKGLGFCNGLSRDWGVGTGHVLGNKPSGGFLMRDSKGYSLRSSQCSPENEGPVPKPYKPHPENQVLGVWEGSPRFYEACVGVPDLKP